MSTDEVKEAVRAAGHVFPQWIEDGSGERLSRGITKRELIAVMVMQGLLAGKAFSKETDLSPIDICEVSVDFADALLAALEASND